MPSRSELGVWCWAASSPRIGRDWSVVLRKRRPLVARGKQEDVGALMPHPGQHLSRFRAGYAERVDLAAMVPSPEIASTGYCLVNSGSEWSINPWRENLRRIYPRATTITNG